MTTVLISGANGGLGLEFVDRGEHDLKGIGPRRLYAFGG